MCEKSLCKIECSLLPLNRNAFVPFTLFEFKKKGGICMWSLAHHGFGNVKRPSFDMHMKNDDLTKRNWFKVIRRRTCAYFYDATKGFSHEWLSRKMAYLRNSTFHKLNYVWKVRNNVLRYDVYWPHEIWVKCLPRILLFWKNPVHCNRELFFYAPKMYR